MIVPDLKYFNKLDAQKLCGLVTDKFEDPFNHRPSPLAKLAADSLQRSLSQNSLQYEDLFSRHNGKMFGVLVVKNQAGEIGYLAGYSGMLNQQWITPGFVPPVFDIDRQAACLGAGEEQLAQLTSTINRIQKDPKRLQAIEALACLGKKHVDDLQTAKARIKNNKSARRAKRNDISGRPDEQTQLKVLSLLSQQDKRALKQLKLDQADQLKNAEEVFQRNYEEGLTQLKTRRRQLSQQLHEQVFAGYRLQNSLGEECLVKALFNDRMPPGGSGDCAAPKLLQFAFKHHFKPVALAEFWWGDGPSDGIRHHGEFYPPCRGKCHPILPFMLQGLDIAPSTLPISRFEPDVLYEDDQIIVLNKPDGLLSIPGKGQPHSVLSWLQHQFPRASGPLLVHRLDMATSGLLLATKNADAHKHLQKQFLQRTVEKRYFAVLSKSIDASTKMINLPLRVDLDDRPRQLVCYQHGKPAMTRIKLLSSTDGRSRVRLYPHTGRTHQLRVHAAHSLGLSAPIVGDALYGQPAERMLLHAEKLGFDHPLSGKRLSIETEVPF